MGKSWMGQSQIIIKRHFVEYEDYIFSEILGQIENALIVSFRPNC